MQVGLSIYSLLDALNKGMSLEDAIQWIKDNGGEHMEIVEFAVHPEIEGVVERIRTKAEAIGLRISGYCTPGNVLTGDPEQDRAAVEKLKGQIDIGHRLGAPRVRCDLSQWGRAAEDNVIENYQRDLPWLSEVCRELADYAAGYGMVLTVENHGTYINGGDRVRQLILGVDRPNFRCTLDVGNAICVDEDPLKCMEALLPFAATVHFKDFYLRDDDLLLDKEGWMKTNGGRYFRGAIVGQGELPVAKLMKKLKESGYDGDVCIEFEGVEDCCNGSRISMANVRTLSQL